MWTSVELDSTQISLTCVCSRLLTSRKKPFVPLRCDYPAAGVFRDIARLIPGKRRSCWRAMTLTRRRAFAFAVPGISWMDDWAPSHTGHVLGVEVVKIEQWSRWVGRWVFRGIRSSSAIVEKHLLNASDAMIELYIYYWDLLSSKRFEWHTLSTKQQLCYDICHHLNRLLAESLMAVNYRRKVNWTQF